MCAGSSKLTMPLFRKQMARPHTGTPKPRPRARSEHDPTLMASNDRPKDCSGASDNGDRSEDATGSAPETPTPAPAVSAMSPELGVVASRKQHDAPEPPTELGHGALYSIAGLGFLLVWAVFLHVPLRALVKAWAVVGVGFWVLFFGHVAFSLGGGTNISTLRPAPAAFGTGVRAEMQLVTLFGYALVLRKAE